jgi:CheY-like chemotaxis protein
VDDSDLIRKTFAELLMRSGYSMVSSMTSGPEAVHVIKVGTVDSPIDILVTDCEMPVMDGLELIREVRSFNADLPIIGMSGSWENQKPMMDAGASAFLLKPLNLGILIGCIERLTRKGVTA